jgi:hypothetical protein
MGAALFRSEMLSRTTRGASLWASQTLGPFDARINYLVSQADTNPSVQSISLTTQEKLTPRISALQVTTFSAGKTSVAFGGSLLTNLLTPASTIKPCTSPSAPITPSPRPSPSP